jgi:hypothetical protein
MMSHWQISNSSLRIRRRAGMKIARDAALDFMIISRHGQWVSRAGSWAAQP